MAAFDQLRALVKPRIDPPRLIYRVHESRGRLRFRLTWLHDRPDDAGAIARALADGEGVLAVRVRAYTGSVLLLFDPRLTDGAKLERALLSATGVAHLSVPGQEKSDDVAAIIKHADEQGSDLAHALSACARQLHVDFLRLTGGRVSLGVLASLGLWAGAALRVVASGRLGPPEWHQMLWWGLRTFSEIESSAVASVSGTGDAFADGDDD
jgi:hypothetical protein